MKKEVSNSEVMLEIDLSGGWIEHIISIIDNFINTTRIVLDNDKSLTKAEQKEYIADIDKYEKMKQIVQNNTENGITKLSTGDLISLFRVILEATATYDVAIENARQIVDIYSRYADKSAELIMNGGRMKELKSVVASLQTELTIINSANGKMS